MTRRGARDTDQPADPHGIWGGWVILNNDLIDACQTLQALRTRRRVEERFPALRESLERIVATMARLPPAKRPRALTGALNWIRAGAQDVAIPLLPEERAAVLAAASELERLAAVRRRIARGEDE